MKPIRHAALAMSLAALVALPACGDDDDDDTPAPADTSTDESMTEPTTMMTEDTAMAGTTGG